MPSTTRYGLAPLLILTTLLASCAGRMTPKTTVDPAGTEIAQLWADPGQLESRDLFHGAGGRSLAPDPSARFALVATDTKGYSAGYDVRDPQGVSWSVKTGKEAQPEIVVSRVLWAMGYHQPPTYLLTQWQLDGGPEPNPGLARFRRETEDRKVVGEWSWYENPFVDTQPFKGLVVANLILNNWDWKTSNNKVYGASGESVGGGRLYVVRDLGASLGQTSFPGLLNVKPLSNLPQGSRNDVEDFEKQGFIKGVDGQRVKFDYNGIHGGLVDRLTVNDVVWACRLMARISDAQWNDAFRAAGYPAEVQQRYVAKLKAKIGEGLAIE
jgi:hypothetical protein